MNKLILVLIFTLALCNAALAQSNFTDDTFVITTYYPAPYGVYRNMRLQPSDEPTVGVEPGVMYYNQTENIIKFRNDTAWVNMTMVTVQQNITNPLLCRPPGYAYDVLCAPLSNGALSNCPINVDCDNDGYNYLRGDCQENNAQAYPNSTYAGAADGVDNNCDGKVDEFVIGVTSCTLTYPVVSYDDANICAYACQALNPYVPRWWLTDGSVPTCSVPRVNVTVSSPVFFDNYVPNDWRYCKMATGLPAYFHTLFVPAYTPSFYYCPAGATLSCNCNTHTYQ